MGDDPAFGLPSEQVDTGSGSSPRSSPRIWSGSSAWVCSRCFLRWNQGQELRQALITIAISVILADQMIAHFGSFRGGGHLLARCPRAGASTSQVAGVEYTLTRLFVLAPPSQSASPSGCGSREREQGWSSEPEWTTERWSRRSG